VRPRPQPPARGTANRRCTAQLVVLARWPAPLRCKSRLAAGVGSVRAAAVQRRLSGHVLQVAAEAVSLARSDARVPAAELVLAASGLGPQAAQRWGQGLGADRTVLQGRGGLGLRLQRQLRRARREGATRVVLIGSDLPELAATDLLQALELLGRHPLVLGPAVDGGYWLIGLGGLWPALFAGHDGAIPWGGDQVLAQTLQIAGNLELEAALLPLRPDLDHPSDLARWR